MTAADTAVLQRRLGAAAARHAKDADLQGAMEVRIVAAEQAVAELLFAIAEHVAGGTSIEALCERVTGFGHGKSLDLAREAIAGRQS